MTPLRSLLFLIAGSAILQPTLSQKWKQMEIAQQQLSVYYNSTTSQLNDLLSKLTPNQSSSLECLLFGNEGCKFICDLKCLMYGCVSAPICNSAEDVCLCRESYRIGNEYVSSRFYRFLPLIDLWNYRFERNPASIVVSNYIAEDLKATQAVGSMLQDPRFTGAQIKHKLIRMFPDAEPLLADLHPIVRGKIDTFLSPRRHFDYPVFIYFMNDYVKAKYPEIERMRMKESTGLEKYLKDHENIKYMVRQLLLFPSEYMETVMDTFGVITGIPYEDVANLTNVDPYITRDPRHQLTAQQIDEIVQAGAFSQLLEMKTIFTKDDDQDSKE